MSEEKKSIDKATGELITNAFSPASTEFGRNIEPAAKAAANIVNISAQAVEAALSPLYLLIWGADKIKAWLNKDVAEHLKNVPDENLITPDPSIAGPAIEAMRFIGNNDELKELFSKLLATSMDSRVSQDAHPSYVDLIKQLNSDEAKILKYIKSNQLTDSNLPLIDVRKKIGGNSYENVITNFSNISYLSGCRSPERIPAYLDNLARLKIIEIPNSQHLQEEKWYKNLEDHPQITPFLPPKMHNTEALKKMMRLTNYGKMFMAGCVS